MNTMFLCLLSDIELHQGRPDSSRDLLQRASRLADATGEHAFARGIVQRLAAQSVEPV